MNIPINDKFLSLINNVYSYTNDYEHFQAVALDWIENLNEALAPYFINDDCVDKNDIKILKNGIVSRVQVSQPDYNQRYLFALLLSRGSTIVYNHIEKKCPLIADVYDRLYNENSILSHFNLYWSPAGARGAGEHVDQHDVIVVQMSGKKRWKVGNENITLRAGDVLLVRKNVLHDPITETDEDSLHLTVGLVSNSGRKVNFDYPLFFHEKNPGSSYEFIRNMNLISRSEFSNLEFPSYISFSKDQGKIKFSYDTKSVTLKSNVFKYLFTEASLNNIFKINVNVEKNHLLNIVLTFYKEDIPFRIA